MKSLSIIIPAYNEERHIKACLESIAAQTEPPEQVIVADNNSIDATAEIARSYDFVTVVEAKDQGVVFARDAGFNAATTDIIGRIDADVRLPESWVHDIKQLYEDPQNEDAAFTGGVRYYNLRLPGLTAWIQNKFVFRLNRMLMGHYILFGSNMALPRAAWLDVRDDVCHRTDIHEDLDLSIHLDRADHEVIYRANLITYAKMRRVFDEKENLWANLMWWPQTLRIHDNDNWVIAWTGAFVLYIGAPLIPAIERISHMFGREPLKE